MFLVAICFLLPPLAWFLIGVSSLPYLPSDLQVLIERFTLLITILLLWTYAEKVFLDHMLTNKANPSKKRTFLLALLAFALLALVHLLRLRIETNVFVLLLTTLGIKGLASSAETRGKSALSMTCYWVSGAALAYISSLLFTNQWLWQPLVFSLGIGAISLTGRILFKMKEASEVSNAQIKVLTLALLGLPVALSMLSLSGQLPTHYLLTYLPLPLLTKVANRLYKERKLKKSISRLTTGIFLLILAIILACRFHEISSEP